MTRVTRIRGRLGAIVLCTALVSACEVSVAPRTDGTPSQLALVSAPAGAMSGNAFTTQPVLAVLDAEGRPVTDQTGAPRVVQVVLGEGTGLLGGIVEAEVRDGVARFDGLGITGGGSHGLRFTLVGHPVPPLVSSVLVVPPSDGVRLNVGASSVVGGRLARQLEVPLLVDLQNRGAQDLSALTVRVTWDPQRLSYVGNDPGDWRDVAGNAASVTVNTEQASAGEFRLSGFSVQPTTTSFRARTLRFSPLQPGSSSIAATVTVAGTSSGASLPLVVRHLDVRVLQ